MEYLFWYKIISMLTGLAIVYLGYSLFVKGIFSHSGDLDASFKNYKLTVRKAAPGTFFVLFGSAIIAFSVYKGLELESGRQKSQQVAKDSLQPPVLPDTLALKKLKGK